jgi:DNA modification methylase
MVFDPFVGCGATVLAAEQCALPAVAIDSHPFIVRIAKAKLNWRSELAI